MSHMSISFPMTYHSFCENRSEMLQAVIGNKPEIYKLSICIKNIHIPSPLLVLKITSSLQTTSLYIFYCSTMAMQAIFCSATLSLAYYYTHGARSLQVIYLLLDVSPHVLPSKVHLSYGTPLQSHYTLVQWNVIMYANVTLPLTLVSNKLNIPFVSNLFQWNNNRNSFQVYFLKKLP